MDRRRDRDVMASQDWQETRAQTKALRPSAKRVHASIKTAQVPIKRSCDADILPPKSPVQDVCFAPPPWSKRQERAQRRGLIPVDARIDLHGMTQIEAYRALHAFVLRGYALAHRHLLVITGYGVKGQSVLRREVPLWCAAPPLADVILSLKQAGAKQGGQGAVILVLRKARKEKA